MVVDNNIYGGISEQVFCCLHPIEQNSLGHFAAAYCLTPFDFEPVALWNAYWFSQAFGQIKRREAFEDVYGFTFGERVNPITGELVDVIIISNTEYFDYLCDWIYGGEGPCGDCTLNNGW